VFDNESSLSFESGNSLNGE